MNFLTHAAIAIDILDVAGADRDRAVVGAVAPDLSGRLRARRAGHFGGRALHEKVRREAPDWTAFALGLATHGNDPPAVDSACHGPEGVISLLVNSLVETAGGDARFHRVFHQPVWWHLLAELVEDYLLLKDRPEIAGIVERAFRNTDLSRAAGLYSGAFGLDARAVEDNLARLRKWNISYYLDAEKYHFIFHRVWRRLKRGEIVPEVDFHLAFETAIKVLDVGRDSRYHYLLSAAGTALAAFS